MLYNIIIAPIETIVDWIFNLMLIKFSDLGVIGAVAGVSLAINFLTLPLYNIADALKDKERDARRALEPRVKRIKKAFKGDEQFMILSTYYRENDYHPLYVLRSSLSILIEIPFFIAAYHYLSSSAALSGASFWIFKDLGSPDSLIYIAAFPINVLPIIMTLINFLSGAIYTRGGRVNEKIQIYVVALIFLALLYNSPSGLVIYWILNNLFSLLKNIVLKMKRPKLIAHGIISALVLVVAIYFFIESGSNAKKICFLIFAVIITLLPFIYKKYREIKALNYSISYKESFSLLLSSGIALAILTGLLLPSLVIATSPSEFSYLGETESPLTYIKDSFCIFSGFFILWPLLVYKMFSGEVRKYESSLFSLAAIVALVDAFILKPSYGNLSYIFELDNPSALNMGKKYYLFSLCLYALILFILFIILKKNKIKYLSLFFLSIAIAEASLGIYKCTSIKSEFELLAKSKGEHIDKDSNIDIEYNLSMDKENVIVIFLDRGIGPYVPKIFSEFPEIGKSFEGFIDYPNTISFSNFTITGTPAMLGGYEYTPERMNERKDEKLRDKHNEAILVMPKLFLDAGYNVTVTDPPWPNYYAKGDLSFFESYPEIKASEIEGKYYNRFKEIKALGSDSDSYCRNGIVDFITLESLPPFLRSIFYNNMRRRVGISAKGNSFFNQLSSLYFLREMTDFSAENRTFTYLENQATHEAFIDLASDYESMAAIQTYDNSKHHYEANIAVLKQIGKWLDYLKENDAYDNSRIIIVSDHGRDIKVPNGDINVAYYSAMLLVKDFNKRGPVEYSDEFMTNADTLFFAIDGLGIPYVNPFTGKKLKQDKENGVNIYNCIDWNAEHFRNERAFELDTNSAFHVSDDIYKEENWTPLKEYLKETR